MSFHPNCSKIKITARVFQLYKYTYFIELIYPNAQRYIGRTIIPFTNWIIILCRSGLNILIFSSTSCSYLKLGGIVFLFVIFYGLTFFVSPSTNLGTNHFGRVSTNVAVV